MNSEFALEIWEQIKAPGQNDKKVMRHSERQQPPDEMPRNDQGQLQCSMTAKVWQHRNGFSLIQSLLDFCRRHE
jgi:hypothetical protein